MHPEHLKLLQAAALAKARHLASKKAPPPGTPGGRPLTPADMSQNDIEQKAMGLGLLDPDPAAPQPTGGVDQAPANILEQTAAGKGAPPQPAPAAPVAPPAPTKLGPGVQVDGPPTIKPTPPIKTGMKTDMPNPHAPAGNVDPDTDNPEAGDDRDGDDDYEVPFRRLG